ncbi:MAG: hypothetical protein ACREU7_04375 [Burkholderiales bacterium]
MFWEEGRFAPGGFVHLGYRKAYFETADIVDQVLHFSSALADGEQEELSRAFDTDPAGPSPPQS